MSTYPLSQAIQEATASEPLTLEEEYENQESWRASHDKLTFILCQAQPAPRGGPWSDLDEQQQQILKEEEEEAEPVVDAGDVDTPGRMIGDINFFLYPFDDDDNEGEGTESASGIVVGEIDIMIASPRDRGQGLGRAAVAAFLHYIWANRGAILDEYYHHRQQSGRQQQEEEEEENAPPPPPRLRLLMAKIKASNAPSIALFKGLGFEQEGEVNYFGEVKLVLKDFDSVEKTPGGYNVVKYRRLVD